jgi:dipeptidyl aminopeptidase/acylaminoacyl peptidase
MRRRVCFFLASAILVAAAVTATAASGGASSASRAGIYSVYPDGTDKRLDALPEPPLTYFVRSPDGRTVLFKREVDGVLALFAAEPTGANPVRLTPPEIHIGPGFSDITPFSPDGGRVAFGSFEGLYVVAIDASNLRRVADSGGEPSWAPGGRRFVYETVEGGGGAVYVADLKSQRTTYVARGTRPQWAPRGSRIAYSAVKGGYGVACFVNADGSRRRCTHGHSLTTLLWSPDAKRVAFRQSYPSQLGTVDPSARHFRYLGDYGRGRPVAWSSTGKRLAVSYGSGGAYSRFVDVVSLDRRMKPVRAVEEQVAAFRDFRWRDGRISYVALLPF